MTENSVKRKLTAILCADVKGYSRLMGEDEVGTFHTLSDYLEIVNTIITVNRGNVFSSPGDAILAQFASVVDAVECAAEIQNKIETKNADVPEIEPASLDKMAYPLPEKPSIAVLPFDNMSGDPNQEYIADAVSENIISDLSKISDMFVIARNSTFTYKGKPVKVQQVSEELGVRYVLEGSAQKIGNRVRITAQLIDATTGHHLWSEKYDRNMKDLFALQDEITHKIIVELQVKLTEGEQARVSHKSTTNLEAWSYAVRGLKLFERVSKENNAKAMELFERAVELDPGYIIALGPTNAQAHVLLAVTMNTVSRFDDEIELVKKAMRLHPYYPAYYLQWLGPAYPMTGRFEDALQVYKQLLDRSKKGEFPSLPAHLFLADVYVELGREEEAQTHAAEVLRIKPGFSLEEVSNITTFGYKDPAHLERRLNALRKAGIPETPPLALPEKPKG